MFALKGGNAESGYLAYVDFRMMDTISNLDRLHIKAIVHIINDEYLLLAKDFQKLGLTKEQDLEELVGPLERFLGSLGAEVGNFNLKCN